ncbi:MAG: 4-alpha-glucanotransferase [Acidobacteria bacterium]|nr:4-alpha-glucanotransferase [Acidobacteriota bacterium]MBI3658650.1 4-alpha-glucanotransferase [Acidobacteriota bacterium]
MNQPAPCNQERISGLLLHPTSLPGRFGIGELGPPAFRFVDFLAVAGQRCWQILPLGPAGYGDSPYQCFSSMAGNPLLISLYNLAEEGWLDRAWLEQPPVFSDTEVNYGQVIAYKSHLLKMAADAFFRRATIAERSEFEAFCDEKRSWLPDFAEFMARKEANGSGAWTEWQPCAQPHETAVQSYLFMQYQFFQQWRALKTYCAGKGIEIIGDIPIFAAHDSADVWSHPEFFDLKADGRPRKIAGVPPDYFSATGQCWGNPLYRWDVMADTGYSWWIDRVRATLEMVDWIRLDHFRGFDQYYEIHGGATTAVHGQWRQGPGDAFFAALKSALGRLPLIAEDLGVITPEVEALRNRWGFPGMRILQFAFGQDPQADSFKPHNHARNCVVYTGTHDNDTVVGWFTGAGTEDSTRTPADVKAERLLALRYLGSDGRAIHWDFIRAAMASVADRAIIPLQDLLGLGAEARMNLPGRSGHFWRWRCEERLLTDRLAEQLRQLTALYGRCPPIQDSGGKR